MLSREAPVIHIGEQVRRKQISPSVPKRTRYIEQPLNSTDSDFGEYSFAFLCFADDVLILAEKNAFSAISSTLALVLQLGPIIFSAVAEAEYSNCIRIRSKKPHERYNADFFS